jgi:hypothetical protein
VNKNVEHLKIKVHRPIYSDMFKYMTYENDIPTLSVCRAEYDFFDNCFSKIGDLKFLKTLTLEGFEDYYGDDLFLDIKNIKFPPYFQTLFLRNTMPCPETHNPKKIKIINLEEE